MKRKYKSFFQGRKFGRENGLGLRHGFSLTETRGVLKWIDWALRKLGYSGQIRNF
jgi:hypothetical protein